MWDVRPWLWLFLILMTGFYAILAPGYYALANADPAAASNLAIKIIGADFVVAYQIWLILLGAIVILSDIYWLGKGLHALINNSSVTNAIDEAFMLIPVKCVDEDVVAKASKLNIAVTPDRVYLPKEIIQNVSPEALANIMCWLFYLRLPEIHDDARRQSHTAFHSLADQLISAWTYQKIMKFLEAVNGQKEYIGKQMEAAFDRRELEMKVESLQIQIDKVKAREQAYMINDVDESVDECKTLLSGKSALINWFKKKTAKVIKPKK